MNLFRNTDINNQPVNLNNGDNNVGLGDILHNIVMYAHLISKAGSLISSKSPSPAFRWSGIYYKDELK